MTTALVVSGGFAVVAGEEVATVPLPLDGLVSPQTVEVLVAQLEALDRAAADLGCRLERPRRRRK